MCTLRPHPHVLLLASAAGLLACNPQIESYTPGEVEEAEVGDTFTPPQYWIMKQVTTTVVDVPVLSSIELLAAQSANYYVIEWIQDGTSITQNETICDIRISDVMGISTSMPPQFFDCCSEDVRPSTLDREEVGATYAALDHLTLYGVELADPWNDALPTDANDGAVRDTDADGEPGITSIIEGWLGDGYAEVYLAQRSVTNMTGTLVNQGRIEGYVQMGLEQVILGASEGDDWATADGYGSKQDEDPEHNFFILQALDHPMTCDEMLAAEDIDALFE